MLVACRISGSRVSSYNDLLVDLAGSDVAVTAQLDAEVSGSVLVHVVEFVCGNVSKNIPLVVSEIEIGLKSQRKFCVGVELAYLAAIVENEALAVPSNC